MPNNPGTETSHARWYRQTRVGYEADLILIDWLSKTGRGLSTWWCSCHRLGRPAMAAADLWHDEAQTTDVRLSSHPRSHSGKMRQLIIFMSVCFERPVRPYIYIYTYIYIYIYRQSAPLWNTAHKDIHTLVGQHTTRNSAAKKFICRTHRASTENIYWGFLRCIFGDMSTNNIRSILRTPGTYAPTNSRAVSKCRPLDFLWFHIDATAHGSWIFDRRKLTDRLTYTALL